jgi:alpha-L-fucosidase
MKTKLFLLLLCVLPALAPSLPRASVAPPKAYGAIPSERQLRWHELETYAFVHFTTNTFTDKEWGYGDEDPKIFNPTAFDADQIITSLKAGGLRGVILTAKHHDGFCLWPTKTTAHNISKSSWKNGKGDMVKEFADAARRHGLKFGVYLSPWDRNNASYGQPEYLRIYREQLRELLTNYGELYEVWHDGANGGDGFYGGARESRKIDKTTYYDWPATWELVRKLQPKAVVFSDAGPDVRWVGNEKGIAGDPCWATINGEHIYPGMEGIEKQLNSGDRAGSVWRPAECDVSIRPGWFWHEKENSRVKTPQQLMDLYFVSVGRGASFLLNVPPDRRGRIHENDVNSLKQFGDQLRQMLAVNFAKGAKATPSNVRGNDKAFAASNVLDGDRFSYWATDDKLTTAELELDLRQEKTFNVARLRENIRLGQRVDEFAIDVWKENQWVEAAKATGIGAQRLLRLPKTTTGKVRLRITKAAASPCISEFSLFLTE